MADDCNDFYSIESMFNSCSAIDNESESMRKISNLTRFCTSNFHFLDKINAICPWTVRIIELEENVAVQNDKRFSRTFQQQHSSDT
jgi:hypothetical protein